MLTGASRSVVQFARAKHIFIEKKETQDMAHCGQKEVVCDVDYNSWVRCFDVLSEGDVLSIVRSISTLRIKPSFSILMPINNANMHYLRQSIESVVDQLYPHWQLCIVDDASVTPEVRLLLDEYRLRDNRVFVMFRQEQGGRPAAANTALRSAAGDFITIMDSGDIITKHALYMAAAEINVDPATDMLYSDEDKIDEENQRYDPDFKPDWNPALILSRNFFGRMGLYRRSIVNNVNGFSIDLEGAEDYDLLLRCLERTKPQRIRHVASLLYHRRIVRKADSDERVDEKVAWESGCRAIARHLDRLAVRAEVARAADSCHQVIYALPENVKPQVSIIIPTTARLELIKKCVLSLRHLTTYLNYDVYLAVKSSDLSVSERREFLESLRDQLSVHILIYERSFTYAWVNNWAAAQVSGSIICFMNDDVEVITPDWLEVMVARLLQEGVGAVGPMLYYPNGTIQHTGVILGSAGVADHPFRFLTRGEFGYSKRAALEQDLSCVTGACMLIRRDIFESLHGFSEDLEIAYNDVDLCIRVRKAGWRIIWTPCAEFFHHESVTVGRPESPERAKRFAFEFKCMRDRWGAILDHDPFYNPNLSLEPGRLFCFGSPPRSPRPWVDASDQTAGG